MSSNSYLNSIKSRKSNVKNLLIDNNKTILSSKTSVEKESSTITPEKVNINISQGNSALEENINHIEITKTTINSESISSRVKGSMDTPTTTVDSESSLRKRVRSTININLSTINSMTLGMKIIITGTSSTLGQETS
jgi:hypothetical protein